MGFWFRNWARYDYINVKLTTDPITQRGFAAWSLLTLIVVTSSAPVRRINYEVFVISHLVTFAGFVAAVWLHAPDDVKVWVWLPIGFFALDRLLRARRVLYLNLTPFHFWKKKADGLWANSASFNSLPGGVTRISIDKPAFRWTPGQHVFLSCHSLIPLQSHPFTIASLPSDGKLEFLVKAHRGGTRSFLNHADQIHALPLTRQESWSSTSKVGIEGPYGHTRNLGQFDSVVLFAGSTGAAFTVPQMRHIVQSWRSTQEEVICRPFIRRRGALTRRIRFVWVVKSRDQLDWFRSQLQQVVDDTTICASSRIKNDRQVDISVYATCDEVLSAEITNNGNCCNPVAHEEPEQTKASSTEKTAAEKKDVGCIVEMKPLASIEQGPSVGQGCAPDGSCCCKATVEDESDAPVCTCGHESKTTTSTSPTTIPDSESQRQSDITPNPSIRLLSGRPQPRSIIRKVLEEAEGESAVVVCGPQGLRDDVRASVVALSDERAVHKGTGAQGIYLHVEGFGY
jgi:FAD-binding domain/Ferric reductase NAD binding domain/Ferric reductase like transmembrane component